MSAWHWYTKARRVPTLIGKDAAGRRIPGGPYTALQAIAALVTPATAWSTRALWAGQLTGLATLVAVLALSFGVVKLLGKVDFASRNPLLLTGSVLRQVFTPPGGTLAGTALRPRQTRRIRSHVVVGHLPDPTPTAATASTTPLATASTTASTIGSAGDAVGPTKAAEPVPAGVAESKPTPRRGNVGSATGNDPWGSAATVAVKTARPVIANGLESRSTNGAVRRSGLEAFLSPTTTKEEAA